MQQANFFTDFLKIKKCETVVSAKQSKAIYISWDYLYFILELIVSPLPIFWSVFCFNKLPDVIFIRLIVIINTKDRVSKLFNMCKYIFHFYPPFTVSIIQLNTDFTSVFIRQQSCAFDIRAAL